MRVGASAGFRPKASADLWRRYRSRPRRAGYRSGDAQTSGARVQAGVPRSAKCGLRATAAASIWATRPHPVARDWLPGPASVSATALLPARDPGVSVPVWSIWSAVPLTVRAFSDDNYRPDASGYQPNAYQNQEAQQGTPYYFPPSSPPPAATPSTYAYQPPAGPPPPPTYDPTNMK